MASITVRVSDEMSERLKARVTKNGISMSSYVIEAILSVLDGDDDFDRTNWEALGQPKMAAEVVTRFKREKARKPAEAK